MVHECGKIVMVPWDGLKSGKYSSRFHLRIKVLGDIIVAL